MLDRMQRALAAFPPAVRFAILLRNQARCVIKYHLSEGPDVADTGEGWLQSVLAPHCSTFVDVGANVGDWLAGIAQIKSGRSWSALAFEPSRSAAELLRKRFDDDTHVGIIEAAVGDEPGTLTFFEEEGAGKGSSLVPAFNRKVGTQRAVRIATLDVELGQRNWRDIDFLKIDAEGYDMRVIRGASALFDAQHVGVVQFEYNRPWQLAGETLRGAYRFLEERGYEVYLLKREGLFRLNYALYEEYYEYSNFVGIAPRWRDLLAERVRGTI